MAQRRLWQMQDEPVSRAKDHGVPSAWRAQRISPRGRLQVEHEVDGRSTVGHIASRKPWSPKSSQWCHTPVAT